ncbi:hypothetical protein GALMADRAFT_209008 [Galerina marginata CBS 339.88]|uniref:Uncharacterized protein n=1 Tax=Galerina marginata (strain CBS 339.88) TaxID=685588 RepID=A0A067THS7_GALM3|nr:hypothetical protein GALMADRAFT_209008 [Galerina marginata CBS 339.88]
MAYRGFRHVLYTMPPGKSWRDVLEQLSDDLHLNVQWDEYDEENVNLVTWRFPWALDDGEPKEVEESCEGSEWKTRMKMKRVERLKEYEKAPVADPVAEGSFERACVEGLQWVRRCYYSGVASWGWLYNYHYAPRISARERWPTKEEQEINSCGTSRKFRYNDGVAKRQSSSVIGAAAAKGSRHITGAKASFPGEGAAADAAAAVGRRRDFGRKFIHRIIQGRRRLGVVNGDSSAGARLSLPGFFPHQYRCACTMKTFDLPTLACVSSHDYATESGSSGRIFAIKDMPPTALLGYHGVNVHGSENRNKSTVVHIQNPYENWKAETIVNKMMHLPKVALEDPRFSERDASSLFEELPDGSKVFFLREDEHGVTTQVSSTTDAALSVILFLLSKKARNDKFEDLVDNRKASRYDRRIYGDHTLQSEDEPGPQSEVKALTKMATAKAKTAEAFLVTDPYGKVNEAKRLFTISDTQMSSSAPRRPQVQKYRQLITQSVAATRKHKRIESDTEDDVHAGNDLDRSESELDDDDEWPEEGIKALNPRRAWLEIETENFTDRQGGEETPRREDYRAETTQSRGISCGSNGLVDADAEPVNFDDIRAECVRDVKNRVFRLEGVKALSGEYTPSLTLFAGRFKTRILDMATSEVDLSIRVSIIHVLGDAEGHLPPEEQKQRIFSLLFDEKPKVRKAVDLLVRAVWKKSLTDSRSPSTRIKEG